MCHATTFRNRKLVIISFVPPSLGATSFKCAIGLQTLSDNNNEGFLKN
jgi:hypothetical protein